MARSPTGYSMSVSVQAAFGPTSGGAGRDPWVGAAESFVRSLGEERWESAGAIVDDAVPEGALTPGRLAQIWSQITAASGRLLELSPQLVTERDALHIVDLAARFERQSLTVRVVFTPARKLTGLWFLPPPPPPWSAPPYVDTSAFEEVEVRIGADPWVLPGSWTRPIGVARAPGVVLIHGSGPNDRDETIGPNRPFKDLAWGLASRGIAVLRYDKRTRVHAGSIDAARFTVEDEVIDDALAAIHAVRDQPGIDASQVYVVGHSLGAMLAPEIARRDGSLGGIILMAAPARPIEELLRDQLEYVATLPGADDASRLNIHALLDSVARLADRSLAPETDVMGAPASYYYDLARYDPVSTARQLSTPILVMHGGRDYQVTDADFRIWVRRLDRDHAEVEEFHALNHLFMEGTGRATPIEYASKPGHVAPQVIDRIVQWIRARAQP